jgi:hypothetical protein
MAKKRKRSRKLSTNEALEMLLGKKAARRLRKMAMRVADEEQKRPKPDKKRRKNQTTKNQAKKNATR